MSKIKCFILCVVFCVAGHTVFSQVEIKGEIKNSKGLLLEGANVILENTNYNGVTNNLGVFVINKVNLNTCTLVVSHLGYKSFKKVIELGKENVSLFIVLEDDLLNLETVVVTGTFDPRTQLESSTSVTTLNSKDLQRVFPRGTADALQSIAGTFVDASAGEVFTKVYSRGISASAEDDLGWYYVSLQEDGLPVSLIQHSYFAPDLFHRLDITTKKVEAIRGGSAAITALNAPGGIYNFISYETQNDLGGEIQLQSGFQGEGNPFYRMDARVGGLLGNNWFFNAGGHYRHDEGARNSNFTFSKGGQFKFNIIKKNRRGFFKLYGKLLDDHTNRWTGVAAVNWDNPQSAFGQDFNTTSLLMPKFNANIPDGRNLNKGTTNSFNPSKGVHAKDFALGLDLSQNLGNNWSLNYNTKFSNKNANWQTSISNAFISLNDPTAYFISDTSGSTYPVGQIVFRDAVSGSELARVDNSGIFSGDPVPYLTDGKLPNDGIMGTSAWYKQMGANEWMDQLTIRKQCENHDFTIGMANGYSNTSLFTQGSFGYVTYEINPKMMRVTVENPNEPIITLSDENGISNYGGLFYVNAEAKVRQNSLFVNDRWEISEKIYSDFGLRYETIQHQGNKDHFAPYSQSGGLDGDVNTAFDNSILSSTGNKDEFNYTYNYLSYSGGFNYKLNDETAIFTRFSKGNKAPELNYYFNNFSNVPINKKGEVQKIKQLELGLKWNLSSLSFTSTLFWSELNNVGVTNFEFDSDTNSIFYTPIQFNKSKTIGLEWESVYNPITYFTFRFNGIIQNPKATIWKVYNAAGSVDTNDDSIVDYSGNQLPFNPNLMFNLSGEYQKDKISTFIKWHFMGQREGNVANAFQLPAYSSFNIGAGYSFSKNWYVNALVTNVFNSAGLANFFGANTFGANANGATKQYIQSNPDASFVVVPILPRGISLKINYLF